MFDKFFQNSGSAQGFSSSSGASVGVGGISSSLTPVKSSAESCGVGRTGRDEGEGAGGGRGGGGGEGGRTGRPPPGDVAGPVELADGPAGGEADPAGGVDALGGGEAGS